MTEPTTIPSVNMSLDIRKAILSILDRSDSAYNNLMAPSTNTNPFYCIKVMDANNDAIRSILNAIG